MSQFEFLTVMISIVLAFGISDILSSWGEQLRLRRSIRPYGLHLAWTALLLVAIILIWWSLWTLRDRETWTFPEYLLLIVPYLTASLMAYTLTPSLTDGDLDIKRYYYDNSRWFFSLAAFYQATWTILSVAVIHEPLIGSTTGLRLAALGLMIGLAVSKNERFHLAAVWAASLMMTAHVAMNVFTL